MCDACDWTLTAPWWRWPKLGAPGRDVRGLQPAIQKYDTSDPVSLFVKEPQKALAYGADDVVRKLVAGGGGSGKLSSFTAATLVPTTTRKLFLPLHKRFYLVACELHCDRAGFPSVNRDRVCEAGMVVRRRRISVPTGHTPEAQALLKTIGDATARIAAIDRGVEKRVLKKRRARRAGGPVGTMGASATLVQSKVDIALDAVAGNERAELVSKLAEARAQLLAWKGASGATVVREGWIPSDYENVGSWQPVDETPQGIDEVIYPLHPLVPDPRVADHDASGKTIWFGLLPTGSREVDFTGLPRFDAEWRYEVRCFVRHHRPECPKTGGRNDCGGRIVWSAPTEAFQLASHFDPDGTGHHPIAIQMPDIPALAASAQDAKLPVQMHFPAGSALQFKVEDGEATNPATNTIPQICFFSIPLITIVATFVLHLFLPIVVFLFQLWFLLGLKFCIPPSFQLGSSAGLDFDLEGMLALDAELDAVIQAAGGAHLANALAADFNLAITGRTFAAVDTEDGEVEPEPGFGATPGAKLRDTYTTGFLRGLSASLAADRTEEVEKGSIVDGLVFVDRVERSEVGA